MSGEIKKILIIKLRKIGDVLLCAPTVRALRENFPDSSITALVNLGTESMLEENPDLNEVLTFDRSIKELPLIKSIYEQWRLIRKIRAMNFDLVVDLTSGDRAAIIGFFSGAKYRLGHDPRGKGILGKKFLYTHLVPHRGIKNHIVERDLDVVRLLGIDTPNKEINFYIPPQDQAVADKLLTQDGYPLEGKRAHLHPTSDWLFKCWRNEAIADLIDYLIMEKNVQVVITSGPAAKEIAKIEEILKLVKSKPLNLTGKTSLKQLGAITKRSQVFFGMDSAPMHLAAALKTPTVTIFGPTGLEWAPWGEGHTVLIKGYPCQPCGKDGCGGSKICKCIYDITEDEVKRAIDKYI